ncbi:hypothetical protein O3G_MSEX012294 [Manduca sexta]|uniref:XPA C-terminal domain-containing protein n=1 Tax=Manduca sexta TaxID=7130 RepID=A0A922CWE6_MANSE|nr:hypothetical protein O3G_MSEX012294 [Manduca sexta]
MSEANANQLISNEETVTAEPKPEPLTAAQRARSERQRLKARALRDARLIQRPTSCREGLTAPTVNALDSGGGFLLEEEDEAPAPKLAARPAPIVHATEQPRCVTCERLFPQSFLFDNFDHPVCDECRDNGDEHALMTRTEAKNEFLLKDCDLDSRPPPLRYLRRRNPHSSRYGDMRLYLRAQVEARALLVWGSEDELASERERREEARSRTRLQRDHKRLRALRLDVRSSLYDRQRGVHTHEFGAESYDEAADQYSRTCATCGHIETYEKM